MRHRFWRFRAWNGLVRDEIVASRRFRELNVLGGVGENGTFEVGSCEIGEKVFCDWLNLVPVRFDADPVR